MDSDNEPLPTRTEAVASEDGGNGEIRSRLCKVHTQIRLLDGDFRIRVPLSTAVEERTCLLISERALEPAFSKVATRDGDQDIPSMCTPLFGGA